MAPAAYLDECVDLEFAPELRSRGFTLQTAAEAGMLGKSDIQHLEHAASKSLLVISQNGRDFRRLHRRFTSEGRPHGGIVSMPQSIDLPLLTVRTAMMLDWLGQLGGHESRFFVWGDLQFELTPGLRLLGYTDADHRLALGQGDKRTSRR